MLYIVSWKNNLIVPTPWRKALQAPAQNIHVNSSTVHDLNNMNDFYTALPKGKIKSIVATDKKLRVTRICFSYYKEKNRSYNLLEKKKRKTS